MLTLGSLFDGSGGFPLGARLAGIKPVWASEIEAFPIAVTKKHFPDMKHYGDITLMDGSKIEPVDIISFGSPCQDMSIAGRHAGLTGSRSGLFFEAIRLIKEMRAATLGEYPKFIIWENVTGALSSNGGEDFRSVLESLCRIKTPDVSIPKPSKWDKAGYIMGEDYSFAWRVLDAQYWGVPQRRKRVFLVGDFTGRRAGKILFKPEGLLGDFAAGTAPWKTTPRGSAKTIGSPSQYVLCDQGGARIDILNDKIATLRAESHHPPIVIDKTEKSVVFNITPTLVASGPHMVSDGAHRLRRMTPEECGMAQGFPVDYCDGIEGSNSDKYKMWGNGVALPCVYYILASIKDELDRALHA